MSSFIFSLVTTLSFSLFLNQCTWFPSLFSLIFMLVGLEIIELCMHVYIAIVTTNLVLSTVQQHLSLVTGTYSKEWGSNLTCCEWYNISLDFLAPACEFGSWNTPKTPFSHCFRTMNRLLCLHAYTYVILVYLL